MYYAVEEQNGVTLSNLSDLITMGCQWAVSEDRDRAVTRNRERDMLWEASGLVLGVSVPKGKGAQTTTDKMQRGFLRNVGMSKVSVLWGDQSPEQGWSAGRLHRAKPLHGHRSGSTMLSSGLETA